MQQKQKNKNEKKESPLWSLLNYEWIVKHIVFFLFVALLAIIYIANGHWADNTIRDINATAKDVKELQYEYKSLKAEEIFKSREKEVVQAATPLGLKITDQPPMRLIMDSSILKKAN